MLGLIALATNHPAQAAIVAAFLVLLAATAPR